MKDKELEIIKELMDKLTDEMEYSEEDFAERLGRKPEIKAIKIEGELPEDLEEELEDDLEESEEREVEEELSVHKLPLDEDDSEYEEYDYDEESEELSPEDELKKRLMKLRK